MSRHSPARRAILRGRTLATFPFVKMHGAGNDFVVLDGIRHELPPLELLAPRLADRHLGVGFDQLLVVRPSADADFRMEIYNADGSQVEMCANGIRAFFKYLRDHGHTRAEEVRVETLGGTVVPRWAGDTNFMSVCGSVRVVHDSLDLTYAQFRKTAERLGLPKLSASG